MFFIFSLTKKDFYVFFLCSLIGFLSKSKIVILVFVFQGFLLFSFKQIVLTQVSEGFVHDFPWLCTVFFQVLSRTADL